MHVRLLLPFVLANPAKDAKNLPVEAGETGPRVPDPLFRAVQGLASIFSLFKECPGATRPRRPPSSPAPSPGGGCLPGCRWRRSSRTRWRLPRLTQASAFQGMGVARGSPLSLPLQRLVSKGIWQRDSPASPSFFVRMPHLCGRPPHTLTCNPDTPGRGSIHRHSK